MSRQPTWDMAQSIQGEMFRTTAAQGGLDVQLVYFRGFGECRASRFVSGGEGLGALMSRIVCQGGRTQIGKVLRHALDESRSGRVGALVFIGDAMEERIDALTFSWSISAGSENAAPRASFREGKGSARHSPNPRK